MQIVSGHRALTRPLRAPAVALGNFDGVHRGHAALFAETLRLARARGADATVLTFSPHPARVLNPRFAPPLITTPQRKLELIAETGVDVCVVEPFDAWLAGLSPAEFVDEVLVRALGARDLCVGYDFTFGKARAGNTTVLKQLGESRGFDVKVLDPVSVSGIVCSSTKVRELVLEGRVDGAALLLGRDFEIDGEVVRGAGRGRTIGIPTANLATSNELLPRPGVYAAWASVPAPGGGGSDDEPRSSPRYAAAVNIGKNPTFVAGENAPMTVEAHLLDYPGTDIYGRTLRLGFRARLRDEQRFPSAAALVEQIGRDIEAARAATREEGAE